MMIIRKLKSLLLRNFYRNISPQRLKDLHVKQHLSGIYAWSKKKYVFIHVPKSAGTSINFSLGMPDIGHLTFSELNMRNPFSFDSNKVYFCVLRDPVQRITSTFRYAHSQLKKNGGWTGLINIADYNSLSSFVENELNEDLVKNHYFFRTTSKFVENAPPNSTYIIDFNNIDVGLEKLSVVLGKKFVLPVKNLSSYLLDIDIDLRQKHIEKIRKLYKEDFVMCEYIKNEKGLLLLADFYRFKSLKLN